MNKLRCTGKIEELEELKLASKFETKERKKKLSQ